MTTRRSFLLGAGALAAMAAAPAALSQGKPLIKVYKHPQCGCCGEWEKHMQANGFRVETVKLQDVTTIKRKYGLPEDLYSCHTGMVEGYVVEGHVPADDVKRMLRERPKIVGIAVPGMPVGSPGMEQGPAQPYDTMAFDGRRNWIFARH